MANETINYGGYTIVLDQGASYCRGVIISPSGHSVGTGGLVLDRDTCIKRCFRMVEHREYRIRDTILSAVEEIEWEQAQ